MRLCSFPNCGRNLYSSGMCRTHYYRPSKGIPRAAPMKAPRKSINQGRVCSTGCGMEATRAGLCSSHYYRKMVLKRPDWAAAKKLHRPRAGRVRLRPSLLFLAPNTLEALTRMAKALKVTVDTAAAMVLEEWVGQVTVAAEAPQLPRGPVRMQRAGATPGMVRYLPDTFYVLPSVKAAVTRRAAMARVSKNALSALLNSWVPLLAASIVASGARLAPAHELSEQACSLE